MKDYRGKTYTITLALSGISFAISSILIPSITGRLGVNGFVFLNVMQWSTAYQLFDVGTGRAISLLQLSNDKDSGEEDEARAYLLRRLLRITSITVAVSIVLWIALAVGVGRVKENMYILLVPLVIISGGLGGVLHSIRCSLDREGRHILAAIVRDWNIIVLPVVVLGLLCLGVKDVVVLMVSSLAVFGISKVFAIRHLIADLNVITSKPAHGVQSKEVRRHAKELTITHYVHNVIFILLNGAEIALLTLKTKGSGLEGVAVFRSAYSSVLLAPGFLVLFYQSSWVRNRFNAVVTRRLSRQYWGCAPVVISLCCVYLSVMLWISTGKYLGGAELLLVNGSIVASTMNALIYGDSQLHVQQRLLTITSVSWSCAALAAICGREMISLTSFSMILMARELGVFVSCILLRYVRKSAT